MDLSHEEKPEIDITRAGRPDAESCHKVASPGTPTGLTGPHIHTYTSHALKTSESIRASYAAIKFPDIFNRKVVGFLGNYGSGKTEVALNFALQLGLSMSDPETDFDGPVKVVDLDIVNMFFRSREAIVPLAEAGVEVVNPEGEARYADLPIILPVIKGHIHRGEGILVLDVGGDDLGARTLSHINQDILSTDHSLLMVVNANRPFTSDIEGAKKILGELEGASGLKINGFVSNTHLMDETDAETIHSGYNFAKELEAETGIPVVLAAAESRFTKGDPGGLRAGEFDCPVLPIYRFMLPPWCG